MCVKTILSCSITAGLLPKRLRIPSLNIDYPGERLLATDDYNCCELREVIPIKCSPPAILVTFVISFEDKQFN